jgi:16S rRNA (cytosine1402-N4)-methyltransferase
VKVASGRLADCGERAVLVHSSFGNLAEVAQAHGFVPADGILFDLGLSSLQLADPRRGFSFMADGPLDMRFDPQSGESTAADLVNTLSIEELADLLLRYGEERQSRRIARAIVATRPLRTTAELAAVISEAVKVSPRSSRRRSRVHPATRTFQALRIAVNEELAILQAALPQAVKTLNSDGRLVVISFHSLEDRIVKRFLRRESRDCVCPPESPICTCDHRATLQLVTRKPVRPTDEEVEANPRARSARLRVAQRVGA